MRNVFLNLKNQAEINSHFGLPKIPVRASLLRAGASLYPRSKYESGFILVKVQTTIFPF